MRAKSLGELQATLSCLHDIAAIVHQDANYHKPNCQRSLERWGTLCVPSHANRAHHPTVLMDRGKAR
jgi:hypothetical protein